SVTARQGLGSSIVIGIHFNGETGLWHTMESSMTTQTDGALEASPQTLKSSHASLVMDGKTSQTSTALLPVGPTTTKRSKHISSVGSTQSTSPPPNSPHNLQMI